MTAAAPGLAPRRGLYALIGTISCSSLGDGIIRVVYPWLATQVGGSTAEVAGMVALANLPYLVLSLPAGILADRVSRLQLIYWVNWLRAGSILVAAALLAVGALNIPLLFALAFVHGAGEVVDNITVQSLTPRLVPADQLRRANGDIYTASFALNRFVGAGLGGLLIAVIGAPILGLSAGLFLLAPLSIALLPRAMKQSVAIAPVKKIVGLRGLFQGLTWLWSNRLSRRVLILVGVSNLIHASATAMNALLSVRVLQAGAAGYSAMLAAVAVGAIAGGQLGRRWTRKMSLRSLSMTDFAVTGICLIGIGLSPWLWLVCLFYALDSFASVIWNVSVVTWRQSEAPDGMLGTVTGAMRWVTWGAVPVGAALGGFLGQMSSGLFGERAGIAIPIIVPGIVYLLLLPLSMRLREPAVNRSEA